MSNSLAIAAVTAALRNILDGALEEVSGTGVSTKPPDKALPENHPEHLLNLFLYHSAVSAAWRNRELPGSVRPGETGHPPLALNLFYLLTAYAKDGDELTAHRLLGRGMGALHDHPVLGSAELEAVAVGDLDGSDVHEQIERVRITPEPLSLDDMYKLWSSFQTQYRPSSAYQVSVVLIDSDRPSRTPLPVVRRGEEDRGVAAVASPSPALTALVPPHGQPAVRLGEDLAILGTHLDAGDLTVRFRHRRVTEPLELEPESGGSAERIVVHLPDAGEDANALERWTPGVYTLTLVVRRTGLPAWTTNTLPFALAPAITVQPLAASAGDLDLTVTCSPRLREGARSSLLLGERQGSPAAVTTPADASQPTTLEFHFGDVSAGSHLVRLRVDGVDSLPIVRTGTPPTPSFDPDQQVTVT